MSESKETKTRVNVMLYRSDCDMLDRFAAVLGTSRSALICDLIAQAAPMLEQLVEKVDVMNSDINQARTIRAHAIAEKLSSNVSLGVDKL